MSEFENEAVVARRASKLSALLAATDETERAVRFPGGRVRGAQLERAVRRWSAAAAIVAVVAIATGVPPVRAWVVAGVTRAWSALTGRYPSVAPAPRGASSSSSVAFVPASLGQFSVQVARRQAEGNLRIEMVADSVATAAALGGSGDWLVFPAGVRLLNEAVASHDYVVRVPRRTLTVVVTIGTERTVVCNPAGGEAYCSYSLRAVRR
jgi:hypothetical protein